LLKIKALTFDKARFCRFYGLVLYLQSFIFNVIDMNQDLTKGQKTFVNKIRKKVSRTIFQNNLLKDGDCVLVGVSGGKDSLALLDILDNRRKAMPFKFEVKAVHINVTNIPYEVDIRFLEQLARKINVDFRLHEITIDLKSNPQLSTCFRCSWARRTTLFKLTEQLGCNKLAFGHHLDDANETLLMNMLFNGEISSLPYSVEMFGGKFDLIRPLLDVEAQDVAYYAKVLGLNAEVKRCPHEKLNRRAMVRNTLEQFYKIHPGIKRNFFRSTRKIIYKYLPLLPEQLHQINTLSQTENNEQSTLCDTKQKHPTQSMNSSANQSAENSRNNSL
jgi:tRNA(Ile)-lysidine synthase TilS/MesJ